VAGLESGGNHESGCCDACGAVSFGGRQRTCAGRCDHGQSSGKLYWRGVGVSTLAESDLSGNTTLELVYFAGRAVGLRNASSGSVYYSFGDQVGSTRVVTDANGVVCYDADYYAFGGENVKVATCPQAYKFTSYERDPETGLDYSIFRYYNGRLGRFMSPDLLAGALGDPQSLNLYAYTANDPISRVDPLGLDWFSDWLCACNRSLNPDTLEWRRERAFWGDRWEDLPGHHNEVAVGLRDHLRTIPGYTVNNGTLYLWISSTRSQTFNNGMWTFGITTGYWYAMGDIAVGSVTQSAGLGAGGRGLGVVKDYFKHVPLAVTGMYPVWGAPIGPAGSVAYNPARREFCFSLGAAVGERGANGGPLLLGNIQNADAIFRKWSWSITVAPSPMIGGQAIWNSSGTMGGPVAGTPGISISYTHGWCF